MTDREIQFRPLTDLGNAERYVAQHGGRVRYVPQWDRFLIWDGKRWRIDEIGTAYTFACETARSLGDEANAAKDSPEPSPS